MQKLFDKIEYEPLAGERQDKMDLIIEKARVLAVHIDDLCEDGREKTLAITKIEEATLWASKVIDHR